MKRLLNREFIWKYRNSLPEGIPSHIKVECIPVSLMAKSILIQRKHQYEYPYQDLHLLDMKGEEWKEVVGLETYCLVSNWKG